MQYGARKLVKTRHDHDVTGTLNDFRRDSLSPIPRNISRNLDIT